MSLTPSTPADHQAHLMDQCLRCQKRIGYTLSKLTPNLTWTCQIICKTRGLQITVAKDLPVKLTPTLPRPKGTYQIPAPAPLFGHTQLIWHPEMLW